MKWKSKNSRNFDAMHFNSSRLQSRKELKLRVKKCLSDESELAKKRYHSPPSSRIDVSKSSLSPQKDLQSSPPPSESVSRINSPSTLHSTRGHTPRYQAKRSVSPSTSGPETNGCVNERRTLPLAELFSRSKTMNGRAQHIHEKRSGSPDSREPPPAQRISRSKTMNFHPFRQRTQSLQIKRSMSPNLNAMMDLPTPVPLSTPNSGRKSIDVKLRTVPSVLGKRQAFSQSSKMKDDATTANAPVSDKSTKRMSSVTASTSIALVQHFIKDNARSHSMTSAGKSRSPQHEKRSMPNFLRGRSMKMREPEVVVTDIITLDEQESMPHLYDTNSEHSDPTKIDSVKEVEPEQQKVVSPSSSPREIASIASKVRSNRSLCHVSNFDEPKRCELDMTLDDNDDESREDQMTTREEFETLGLREEEDKIEKLASFSYLEMSFSTNGEEPREKQIPSLTSEYLGISLSIDSTEPEQRESVMTAKMDKNSRERELVALRLHEKVDTNEGLPSLSSEYLGISLSTDSDELPEERQGADRIPIVNSSFSMNGQLPTIGSIKSKNRCKGSCNQAAGSACDQYGLLKVPCNRLQEAVAGSIDEISHVFTKVTTCRRPHLSMTKQSNQRNNRQANCSFLDPIRESYFNDDDLIATIEEVTSKNHASWDDFTEYDPVEKCISFHLE